MASRHYYSLLSSIELKWATNAICEFSSVLQCKSLKHGDLVKISINVFSPVHLIDNPAFNNQKYRTYQKHIGCQMCTMLQSLSCLYRHSELVASSYFYTIHRKDNGCLAHILHIARHHSSPTCIPKYII